MSPLRSWSLCFFVFIGSLALHCFADNESAQFGDTGKCGRDCIYYVCRSLGQKVSLGEIDRQLNDQTDISFAEMRDHLEKRGFFCKLLTFNARNIGRLQASLDRYPGSIFAIAALPTSSETERHFVVVAKCTGYHLTAIDISNNRIGTVNTADYKGKSIIIPILLVSKEPICYKTFSSLDILFIFSAIAVVFYFGFYFATKWWRLCYRGASAVCQHCVHWFTIRRLLCIGGVAIAYIVLGVLCRESYYFKHPLKLSQSIVDLGEIELLSKNNVYFNIQNRSFRNISIKDVQVSCSCLTIEEYPELIKPKETRVIKLSLIPLLIGDASYKTLIVPESATPIIGTISYRGFQSVQILPRYLNVGLVEKGKQETFSCEYTVEDLWEDLIVIESVTMQGTEPLFEVVGDLPRMLQNKDAFTITIRHRGNAQKGTFLQSFEIRGKSDLGKEITLVSSLVGYVVE